MSSRRTPPAPRSSEGVFLHFNVHLITLQQQQQNWKTPLPCKEATIAHWSIRTAWDVHLAQVHVARTSVQLYKAIMENSRSTRTRTLAMNGPWRIWWMKNTLYCELTFDFHCSGNKADLLVTTQPRKMGTGQACITLTKGLSQLLLSILWTICCLDTCPDSKLGPCQGNKVKSELFSSWK